MLPRRHPSTRGSRASSLIKATFVGHLRSPKMCRTERRRPTSKTIPDYFILHIQYIQLRTPRSMLTVPRTPAMCSCLLTPRLGMAFRLMRARRTLGLPAILLKIICAALQQQSNDQTEESKDGREDLNDENLHKSGHPVSFDLPLLFPMSTHSAGSAASANAALDPLMPTLTPHTRLHMPTSKPAQNSAKPV